MLLALHAELTEIISCPSETIDHSFNVSSSSKDIRLPRIAAANPCFPKTSERTELILPFSSESQDSHFIHGNESSSASVPSAENNGVRTVAVDRSTPQCFPSTIFNPSEALSISAAQDLPPIPDSVLLPGNQSFPKEYATAWPKLDLPPSQLTLDGLFDDESFGLRPDLAHPSYFDETEKIDYYLQCDDYVDTFDGRSNQFGSNETGLHLDLSDRLKVENEMPGSMEYWKDKNDGNRYLQSVDGLERGR
jgi:hypothetical protein